MRHHHLRSAQDRHPARRRQPCPATSRGGCAACASWIGRQHDIGEQLERTVEDPDIGFSPFEARTFEKILRACSARLSSTGIYHPDTLADPLDRTLPDADTFLRLTDTWVLYVRQRSGDFRRDDIARLIRRVDEVESQDELPAPAVSFVVEPSNKVLYQTDYDGLDLSSRDLILS